MTGTYWRQQKKNITNDIRCCWQIDHKLCCPCLEHRPTRHQLWKYEAQRISTGCHKMSSVDHLPPEANVLNVRDHSELLSAQYLARCLEPENVINSITSRRRKSDEDWVKKCIECRVEGRQPVGRPRRTWLL